MPCKNWQKGNSGHLVQHRDALLLFSGLLTLAGLSGRGEHITRSSFSPCGRFSPHHRPVTSFCSIGWRLAAFATTFAMAICSPVRALPDRYANLDRNKPYIAEIKNCASQSPGIRLSWRCISRFRHDSDDELYQPDCSSQHGQKREQGDEHIDEASSGGASL